MQGVGSRWRRIVKTGWKIAATLCIIILFAISADLLIYRFYGISSDQQQQQQAQWTEDNQEIAQQTEANTPRAPTIIGLLAGGNLQRESAYCGDQTQDTKNKWVIDYRCGIKQTDVIAAWASIALVILTIGLIGVGLLQFRVYMLQAGLMSDQLRATERTVDAAASANEFSANVFKATQRPWVSIVAEDIAGPLLFEHNKSAVKLGLTLKNTGSIPAFRVSVWPKIYFIGYGGIHPIVVRREFMEPLYRMPAHQASAGHVLFSGDELRTETEFRINPVQVQNIISDQKSSTLIVIAAVHYQSGILDIEHRTGTIFYLHQRIEDGWTIEFDPRSGTIDAADLKISRHPMGTIAD